MKNLQNITFNEFQEKLNLNEEQKKLLGLFAESMNTRATRTYTKIEHVKGHSTDGSWYQMGKADAYNNLWKLVDGINDDYTYEIFKNE